MATTEKTRMYQGPALLSYGFRPFFLFAAVAAGSLVPLWLGVFTGRLSLPILFSPRDWHAHELLFGYVPAVLAGFLLTAIPNWTGRRPMRGGPLAVLVAIWMMGRAAILFSRPLGWQLSLFLDVTFLVVLAAAAGREIIAGRTWNNLPVVAVIVVFAVTNLAFHIEAHFTGVADYSSRAGIGLIVVLICLIGGRIVPNFTRNWLASRAPGPLPVPFDRFDAICLASGAASIAIWVAEPSGPVVATILTLSAILQAYRLLRWAGYRTASEPLVLMLHLAYAFIPFGFVLSSLSALRIVAAGAGIHAWTVGAIGAMTIAVMTRASLGHTGQVLHASAGIQVAYLAILVAGATRIGAALTANYAWALLLVAGVAWTCAFAGFAITFAPQLCRARETGQ